MVTRSRGGRSSNALFNKARPRATAAVGHCCPASDAGRPPGSELRLTHDDDNRATESVDDVGFEWIGLETEAECEESVWLAMVGDEWERRLRKRRSRSRLFAGAAAPLILALFQRWEEYGQKRPFETSLFGTQPASLASQKQRSCMGWRRGSFGWPHTATHLHDDVSYRLKVLISGAIKGSGLQSF